MVNVYTVNLAEEIFWMDIESEERNEVDIENYTYKNWYCLNNWKKMVEYKDGGTGEEGKNIELNNTEKTVKRR